MIVSRHQNVGQDHNLTTTSEPIWECGEVQILE